MSPDSRVPLVTIGITCHNAADTIERAVRSALKQDWPNTEVVVVDDGSTDGSWSLIEGLAGTDGRMRIIRHESNRGYPGALNTIVEAARGEFIAFFDDDDASHPDRLRAQHARITSFEDASGAQLVFCYTNRSVTKGDADVPDHVALAIGRRAPEPHGRMVADYVLGIGANTDFVWGMFGSCTLMVRRRTLVALGRFDEGFRRSAELDMAVRAAFRGGHFIAVDRPVVCQYKTVSADKAGDLPLKYAIKLRRKHRDYLRSRSAYVASCAIAYANYHGNVGHSFRSRAYLAVALMFKPALLASHARSRLKP